MASSYSLPSSALPHVHQHHMHSHAHTQSQSSITSWKSSISGSGLHSHPEDEDDEHHYSHGHSNSHDHGHSRSNSHNRHHSHTRNSSHASNTSVHVARGKAPPPALDTLNGWTQEVTLGGKSVITPGPDTITAPYTPHHPHDHDHDHDHAHPQRPKYRHTVVHAIRSAHPPHHHEGEPHARTRKHLISRARARQYFSHDGDLHKVCDDGVPRQAGKFELFLDLLSVLSFPITNTS